MMTDLWVPSAARTAATANAGAFTGAPWRGLLHTTEGSSIEGAVGTFTSTNYWPHFTIDPLRKRIVQHLALDVAGRSLRANNRDNCIQIEIVGQAAQSPNWSPEALYFIASVMRQIEALVTIPHESMLVFKKYPSSYGANNGVRLTQAEWLAFSGWCGHQHAPTPDNHGDPGAIDMYFLLAPESHTDPADVKEGRATAVATDADHLDIFAVRHGMVTRYTWAPPNNATPDADLAARTDPVAFYPWGRIAALRQAVGGDLEDMFVIGQQLGDEVPGDWWWLYGYRWNAGTLSSDQMIGGIGHIVDPEAGVAATRRAPGTVELFALSRPDATGRSVLSVVAQVSGQAWSAPVAIVTPTAALAPRRYHGFAAVSRTPGIADIFFINAADGRLYSANSNTVGTWAAPFPIGNNALYAPSHAGLAVISRTADTIDVFHFAKTAADAEYRLYITWWSQQSGWLDASGPHSQIIGGTAVNLQTWAGIAAVSRTPDTIDVFVVGRENGLLYTTHWNQQQNTWSALRQVGGANVTLATVDAAVSRNQNSIELVATGRDGKVYVTTWQTASNTYQPLVAPAALAPNQPGDIQAPLKRLKKTLQDQSPRLRPMLASLRNVAPQSNDVLDSMQALMTQIKQDYPGGDVPADADAINGELNALKA